MQYGYRVVEDMKDGLLHYMDDHNIEHLSDLVGLANKNIIPAEQLDRTYKVYPEIDVDKCVGCERCVISCCDGAHQAMEWDEETRKPKCNHDKCVDCLLCALFCPVEKTISLNHFFRPSLKPLVPGWASRSVTVL